MNQCMYKTIKRSARQVHLFLFFLTSGRDCIAQGDEDGRTGVRAFGELIRDMTSKCCGSRMKRDRASIYFNGQKRKCIAANGREKKDQKKSKKLSACALKKKTSRTKQKTRMTVIKKAQE